MKKLAVFAVFLLAASLACALQNDSGYVAVTIENQIPVITNTTLSQKIFPSRVECSAIVADEYPDEAKIYYNWYVNGILSEEKNSSLYSIKNNDNITCQLTAQDQVQNSSAVNSTITVKGINAVTGLAVLNSPQGIGLPHELGDFLKDSYLFFFQKVLELF